MFLFGYVACLIIVIIFGAHFLVRFKNNFILPHLLAVSTGFIISICIFEFLPTVFSNENKTMNSISLFIGLLSFFLFDKYITPHLKFFNSEPTCKNTGCNTHDPTQVLSKKSSCQSISCLVVCSFFDGLQLGSAHLISNSTQLFFAIALFIHLAPSGALAATLSLSGNLGDKFAIKSSIVIACSLSFGFLISFFISQQGSLFIYLLPFICGVLLYNIFVHLLPAVIKQKTTLITLAITIALSSLLLYKH